jgi:hypothetical protein
MLPREQIVVCIYDVLCQVVGVLKVGVFPEREGSFVEEVLLRVCFVRIGY